MKKNKWYKQFSKSKNPFNTLVEIVGEMMFIIANVDKHSDYVRLLRGLNLEANRIANLNKAIISNDSGEWKLCKAWFPMAFIQVAFRGNSSFESEFGKDNHQNLNSTDWVSKAKFLYKSMGWDWISSLVPRGDDKRTVEEFYYISDRNCKEFFKLIVEPMGVFTIASIWKSSKGKLWECDGIVDGWVLFSSVESVNGKHKNLRLAPIIARAMQKED